jgi:predicted negative regulator of RcsB-dependent stress response
MRIWSRDSLVAITLLSGLVMVLLSFVWPAISIGQSAWSDEKAAEYQSASADVHRLSMQAGSAAPEDQSRAQQDALADAQSKYASLRAELDAAREQPARFAKVIRYAGIVLLVGGLIGLARNSGAAGHER